MKIGFSQNITSNSSGYASDWPNSIFQRIYTRKTDKLTGLWWISPPGENFLNKNFYLKIWKYFDRFCHLQNCKILVGVLIVWVWCGFWRCCNVGSDVILLLVLALFCCWFWRCFDAGVWVVLPPVFGVVSMFVLVLFYCWFWCLFCC